MAGDVHRHFNCWCGIDHERAFRTATRDEMLGLLSPYIRHKHWCAAGNYDMNGERPDCTCGLDAVIGERRV